MCLVAGIMLKDISVGESHAIVIRNLGRLTFSRKKLGKYCQIGCFKVRNSTRNTLTLWQSLSNDMLQNKSFTGEITGNLAHQSSRGNMHKLFDCIRTSLKSFLVCLTFHRKEIRLHHLHKRTNPGSAPESSLLNNPHLQYYHLVM